MNNCSNNKGFTLPELVVSIAILLTIFAYGGVTLLNIVPKADLSQISNSFMADAKSQQNSAMLGQGSGASLSDYSILIEEHRYVLFKGENYVEGASGNYQVDYEEATTASTTFPDHKIVFSAITGDIRNFDPSNNQVVFYGPGGISSTVRFNKLGNVDYVN